MDVARTPPKRTGRKIAWVVGAVALVVVTILISRLKPAAPSVSLGSVIIDSVIQGDMVREVRGPGNLVPEHIRFIPAQASARVDRLVAQSGQRLDAGATLLEMSNPDVEIQAMQADQALNQARADLVALRTNLRSAQLTQEGVVATTNTQFIAATQDAMAADSLAKMNLIARFEATNKHALAEELTTRLRIEKERLALMRQTADSQVAVEASNINRLEAIAQFQHNRLNSLVVKAPEGGVLQDLTLQQGQWVTEGTTLAKIVQPGQLKAVLRIPESQAKDVQLGQKASIDTRNGLIPGHVSRKDPAAIGGTITVDIALDGPLPPGAVPDLSVDGTITIEKLNNVLHTGRPAYGAATGMVGLFKVVEDGRAAVRVQVLLGRNSVNAVEIVRGLEKGDRVILSDMQTYDNVDRVRLK
jgi:multidrug efflux pump subunit AcrA (membrane-fusion protein)